MSEGKRLEERAASSERADETRCWWGLFFTQSCPDQPTQTIGRFHQWLFAWQLFSLPWGKQNYEVSSLFSLFMWLGVNISLLCTFQPSLRNSVFGWAFCLHNVWIQFAWNFDFIQPSSPAPVTSPCVYVCREDSWPEQSGKNTSSQFKFNQMTSTPHKLGRVILLMTLKPQLPAQPVWDDMEMNLWRGCKDVERSLAKASSWGW